MLDLEATRESSRIAARRPSDRAAAVAEGVRHRRASPRSSRSTPRGRCSSNRRAARSAPCSCGDALLRAMRTAACVRLRTPQALARADAEGGLRAFPVRSGCALRSARRGSSTLHGRETIARWSEAARAGDFDTLVDALLVRHYDPMYARSIEKQLPAQRRGDRCGRARRCRRRGLRALAREVIAAVSQKEIA